MSTGAQVYEGLVAMDFAPALVAERGHGRLVAHPLRVAAAAAARCRASSPRVAAAKRDDGRVPADTSVSALTCCRQCLSRTSSMMCALFVRWTTQRSRGPRRRYAPDAKDSGKVHAPVKERWLKGDTEVWAARARERARERALARSRLLTLEIALLLYVQVVDGMRAIAGLVDEAVAALRSSPPDVASFARSLARNWEMRRALYGPLLLLVLVLVLLPPLLQLLLR